MSEDCLHANIWKPKTNGGALPVVVWIHGGGFMVEAGSKPAYWGDMFVTLTDSPIIMVNFNYR